MPYLDSDGGTIWACCSRCRWRAEADSAEDAHRAEMFHWGAEHDYPRGQ